MVRREPRPLYRIYTMAPSLLFNPARLPPSEALQLAQQAPVVLQGSSSETVDQWATYENLLLACLRTSDDEAAAKCMDQLEARFGPDNERVMALRGLLSEAQAENNGELEAVLKQYDAILEGNSTNLVGHDRLQYANCSRTADSLTRHVYVYSLSQSAGSPSSDPWAASRMPQPLLYNSSTFPQPMPRPGLSCRISTLHKGCTLRPSTPWKRSSFCRPMPGTYALLPHPTA